MLDLIIRNAYIADGTGNPGFVADLAVEAGRIVDIGHFPAAQASASIEARGKVLCPGFIDVHVHSEVELLAGRHTEAVQMGVTTEMISPDGFSFAPLLDEYRRYTFGIYGNADIGWDWHSIGEYLQRFSGRCHNNIAAQAPHGLIRLAAKGWALGPANAAEIKAMQAMTREWMEAGAVSLCAGLGYPPGSHADAHEIAILCKVVAEYGGVYDAHMRNYGGDRDASIAETVTIAQEASIPVHIDHFGGTERTYASAVAARAQGIDITWDAYPYMAGCTSLAYGMPPTMFCKPLDAVVDDLRQPSVRAYLVPLMDTFFPPDGPAYFAYVRMEQNKWMEGKTVREVWAQSGKTFIDFYCDLLIEEDLAPLLIYPWTGTPEVNEAQLRHTLTHPLQMVSTDGIYVGPHTHPRGYGAYPRILGRYVREQKWLRLEDAIRRMSSFPAARFGLSDRGLLRKGMAADLVIFDPQTVIDTATYESPLQAPIGIEHVYVNGTAVVANSKLTGKKPGVLVKKG